MLPQSLFPGGAMTSQVMACGARASHTARMKWTGPFTSAVLVVTALVHLLPAIGVLGAERLVSLYGMTLADGPLLVLMRHRALLFGVLGAFMLHAAWSAPLQSWALAAGIVSTLGFIVLAWGAEGPLGTVMWIDVGLLVALVIAALVHRW